MFNLQGSEIIFILLIALVVLGPEKLPEAVRRFGQTYNELKKMGTGFQAELKSALDEPVREMRETAEMVRDAADPAKVAATADAEAAPAEIAPGDPPLVTPPDDEARATDAAPVNRIAAANASGAIAAANTSAPRDDEGNPPAGDGPAEVSAADGEPAPAPTGPSFHSAAPRRIEPHIEDPAVGDDITSPDERAVASSDETATA